MEAIKTTTHRDRVQLSTFVICDRLYGIDVTLVQEVVKPMPMTKIPLSKQHVKGLINLRGQVATAIGVRELFSMKNEERDQSMNVVCRCDGSLISLLVDEIGDVMELGADQYEETPQTMPEHVKRFMSGVYKIEGKLLSVLNLKKISDFLNNKA